MVGFATEVAAPKAPRRAAPSDEALMARVAAADEDALAELYDRFGRVAYALTLRIVRNPTLAEEAVQEAFLAAWRTAGSFRPERATAATWLLTIVHRRAVDLVRREQRRRAEPLETAAAPGDETAADVEAERGELRGVVRAALAALPFEQRQALELGYFGGLTQSEIALRLGCPLGTIKSRTFSGLTRLRELLADRAPASSC
jgi:RNA polymerase sigma-70 factor (ECF subfamily)